MVDILQTSGVDWAAGEDAFPADNENLTGDRRTEARLCAVQALCSVLITKGDAQSEAKEFLAGRVKKTGADKKLFTLIMDEAAVGQERYTALIAAHLLEGWALDRLDPVHHALLWAAAAELTANTAAGPKVVLNEFVNISKGFATPEDVAFLNATLDRMARKIRPGDFAAR